MHWIAILFIALVTLPHQPTTQVILRSENPCNAAGTPVCCHGILKWPQQLLLCYFFHSISTCYNLNFIIINYMLLLSLYAFNIYFNIFTLLLFFHREYLWSTYIFLFRTPHKACSFSGGLVHFVDQSKTLALRLVSCPLISHD